MTITLAFAHFGTTPKNIRSMSWSARSPDEQTVVLTLWKDRFSWNASPISYHGDARINERVRKRPGNEQRRKDLIWARDNCRGLFRVIMVTAKDPDAPSRKVREAVPEDNMLMRITELNDQTGEFRAEVVEA